MQLLRSVTAGGEQALPAWIARSSPQPLIYLTFGTTLVTELSRLSAVVEALCELAVRVVVTVGPDRDPAVLGDQPANVHVARFIPQGELMSRCAAVVSHAGSGVFLATLAYGLPQLCLPQFADQFLNAAVCVRAGAGLALQPGNVMPAAIRAAADQLLSDRQLRAAATTLGQEISRMPDAAEAAGSIASRFA